MPNANASTGEAIPLSLVLCWRLLATQPIPTVKRRGQTQPESKSSPRLVPAGQRSLGGVCQEASFSGRGLKKQKVIRGSE